jgi:uncharacterized protein YecT (DUF1311 family)
MRPVMRNVSRITVCMLLAAPLGGQAEGVADCESRQGTHEQRACYAEAYREAERNLTEVYRKLMNTLSDDYERLLFRHAQIAWKRYRDAQCDLEAYPYRGGPDSAPMRERCLAEQMEARRWQIEAYQDGR